MSSTFFCKSLKPLLYIIIIIISDFKKSNTDKKIKQKDKHKSWCLKLL